MGEKTTIQVSFETKDRLAKLIETKDESYDDIINRILDTIEKR